MKNRQDEKQPPQNQLAVTAHGDTLETGFWRYTGTASGVSKSGNYADGFMVGHWNYRSSADSVTVAWRIFNGKGVKFNIPEDFKVIDSVELPVLFQADIIDNDNNTYLVVLKYDLNALKSSAYDYLYQYNDSWKHNATEKLNSKEFKKFYFKGIEIFRAKLQTKRDDDYEGTSYIFVVKDFLYDLTYKNKRSKSNAINSEVFNDILYSMECDGVDLFDYSNRQYLREENIEFKNDANNSSPAAQI